MHRPWRVPFMLFLALAAGVSLPYGSCAAASASLNDLVRDTQKQGDVPGQLTMVWWVPEEFWTVSFAQEKSLTPQQVEAFLGTVRPYLLVAALDGKIGPMGGAEFVGKDVLQANIRVRDARGNVYLPLAEDKLSADVKNLASMLRTMFGNMMGPMGEGMHMFFFPAAATDGTIIARATQEGSFAVELRDQSYPWRLPLGSLMPRRACPVDGEHLNGAWKFCPWHGKPLEPLPPAAVAPATSAPSG